MSHDREKVNEIYENLLGEGAEFLAATFFSIRGWKISFDKNNGYDFIIEKEGKRYYIEVKTRSADFGNESNRMDKRPNNRRFSISEIEHSKSDYVVMTIFASKSYASIIIPKKDFYGYTNKKSGRKAYRIGVVANLEDNGMLNILYATSNKKRLPYSPNNWDNFDRTSVG